MHSSYFISSNPIKAFNSAWPYFMKTGDALKGIQELLTGITTFRLPLIPIDHLL